MTATMQEWRTSSRLVAAMLMAAVGVAACGGKSGDDSIKAHAKKDKPVATTQPLRPVASDDDSRYATAVVSGKTSAPVDLKYDLSAKPTLGEPFEIELVFQPRLPADTLEIELTGMPGLVVGQQGVFKFEKVQAQTPYTQKVTVQADADGTYYVNVIARMITQVQTEVRTFSIPVVVGTAPAEAKPAPQKDASGQPIESMPATEPKPK